MVAVGEYYARVKIGGQTLRVQIDTGSATLAVPVKECTNCKRGDMRYSMEDSPTGIAQVLGCDDSSCGRDTCIPYGCGKCSTTNACCAHSDTTKCAFHLSFGDGSGAKGVLVRDEFEWGDLKFPVTFGGIRSDSPDFERSQVDGILGMAYPSLACNPSCITPTFESMRLTNEMKDMFSICITYDSGTIVLGDYDPALSSKQVAWVPLDLASPPSFYSFPLIGNMMIDEHELILPSYHRAIVDSGTTLVVFSKATFEKFKRHLQTNYCDVPGLCAPGGQSWFRPAHCAEISVEDLNKMPTITIKLKGFDVILKPQDYMINYASKGDDFWCVGIMALNAMSGGVDVILGNTVMKKYVTIHDRENKRIGFAESDRNCGLSSKDATLPAEGGNDDGKVEGLGDEEGLDEGPEDVEEENSAENVPPVQPETNGESPEKDGQDDKSSGLSGEPISGFCSEAVTCGTCVNIAEKNCTWNSENAKCEEGQATILMCTLNNLAGKLTYVIIGACLAGVLLILLIVFGVHTYRKRQGSSVTSEEEIEPLADNEVDTNSAFAIEDEEAPAPPQQI